MKNSLIVWEKIYKKGQHLSEWPWSDLISLVKKRNEN